MPPHTEREKMTEAGADAAKISEGPILGSLISLPGGVTPPVRIFEPRVFHSIHNNRGPLYFFFH